MKINIKTTKLRKSPVVRTMLTGLLATTLLLSLVRCGGGHEKSEEEPTFPVTTPMRMDTSFTRAYVCQIRAIQHIELRALEKGYLQNIYVDEGEHIKKGQKMFQIMPMLYQAELQKAQAEVNFAAIEYKNTKSLADSNIVSPNELALVKAKYDKAKAELQLAQTHLNFTTVSAPFNGIMDRFRVRLGSLVDEGELLTTLSDNSHMWVYFNVPEAEYLDYMQSSSGDNKLHVQLQMANGKIFDQHGEVTTIEADFNNETGNIAFRATFPNPNGLLRHGETGNILMTVPLDNAMLIPQKATFEILDRQYVFVVDDKNIVQLRPITIGEELTHLYVVTDGLKDGDKIVLDGLRKMRNGDEIKYEFIKPSEAYSQLDLYAE